MPIRIVTVVGARPQFIKAAPVSRAFAAAGIAEVLVHTGQHYDAQMSDIFFQKLQLPAPAHHLGVGSGSHGAQTGKMLEGIERVLLKEKPGAVLVFGDTNSTLAAALAAAKMHIPVAHVEAGLRSFNRRMPEEVNRVVTDHVSRWLFTPTAVADQNLKTEGITKGVQRVGDVMYDCCRLFREHFAPLAGEVLSRFNVESKKFFFATVHRAENTDDPARFQAILRAFSRLGREVGPILWPAHPRSAKLLKALPPETLKGIHIVEPLPYFETQALLMNARALLTDSGGLQKEAAFNQTFCVTLRDETEWVELVDAGVNKLAGADEEKIVALARDAKFPAAGISASLYGDGHAADAIARTLLREVDHG